MEEALSIYRKRSDRIPSQILNSVMNFYAYYLSIELINWVLENMNKPDIHICNLIESKMTEIILSINRTHSIFEADKGHSGLRILDWILYQVCSNEIKRILLR